MSDLIQYHVFTCEGSPTVEGKWPLAYGGVYPTLGHALERWASRMAMTGGSLHTIFAREARDGYLQPMFHAGYFGAPSGVIELPRPYELRECLLAARADYDGQRGAEDAAANEGCPDAAF